MGIEDEADRTLFIRSLDARVTEELLFELFLQAGPLIKTKIPTDANGKRKTFGFAVYKHEESVPYAIQLLNGTSLFGKAIHVQFRSGSTHSNSPGNSNPSRPNPHGLRMPPQLVSSQYTPPGLMQTSSPDTLQKHAMMNMMGQQQMQHLQQLANEFSKTEQMHPSSWCAGSFRQRDNQQHSRNNYHQQNAWRGGSRRHDGRGSNWHYDDRSGNHGYQDSRWQRY
nr:RNA-binding protein 7 [Nerophis lumbriciformis]